MIWLLPDTHLGHRKLIEYCDRLPDFESLIHSNMLKCLKPNDTLIHVTVGWNFDSVSRYFDLGFKYTSILVLGNHDKAWSHTKWKKIFSFVCEGLILKDKLITHRPSSLGIKNIHGHYNNWSHGKLSLALEHSYTPFSFEIL